MKKNHKKYIFIVIIAIAGATLLLVIRAATPTASFEAEDSTLTSNAQTINESTASSGQGIKFGGGTGSSSGGTVLPGSVDVKEKCQIANPWNGGTYIRTDFPHDATTGPEVSGLNEDKLPPSGESGRWTITQAGAVIDSVYHNGIMDIKADNVTIRNSVICGRGGLVVRNYNTNLTIENSRIIGELDDANPDTTPCPASVGYGNYTLIRSELAGCADGIKTSGDIDVRDNWFHDPYTNRGGGGSGTHNDTVQQAGSGSPTYTFEGNSAYQDPCTSNRHFQMAPTNGTFAAYNFSVRNNFFYGIMGINMDRDFTAPGGVFASNTFAGTATKGPFSNGLLYSGTGISSFERSGNVFETGEHANNNPPNYQCLP